ncbi:MAG: ribose 5-phosphate isomerase B [Cytophagaceae bacterium]|nr:ribose 5-phosphate isomerase B [Cytophagaceae bacterium]|tara:strand:+ start:37864 stop:38295 length:432 start_codon:yes stop_codon:yes gene_type:complete
MKIAIGNDHAGFEYKTAIIEHLKDQGHEIINFGTDSPESADYADFIHPVAEAVEHKKVEMGIIICGSGNGANMTANKHQQIRSALCWIKEIAALAREHNDANIISIPSRFTAKEQVLEMVDTFLSTPFAGGRHERRINKIPCM